MSVRGRGRGRPVTMHELIERYGQFEETELGYRVLTADSLRRIGEIVASCHRRGIPVWASAGQSSSAA